MANVTKEALINNIKEWVALDSEIKQLQKEIKERRDKKKQATTNLVEIMKTNEIDCFDTKNGKIIYTKNNVKSSLNKEQLIKSLGQYFSESPNVNPSDVSKFILENRDIKVKENIRIKENK